MKNSEIFSQRLREVRQKKKMTQKDLADKIGTTAATISAYENTNANKRKSPVLENAIEIAKILDVSLDWLSGISVKSESNGPGITESKTPLTKILSEIIDITELDRSTIDIEDRESPDLIPYSVVLIQLFDEQIIEFINSWEKICSLFKEGSITNEMKNEWISGAFKKYEYMYINKNGKIVGDYNLFLSDDDDLPF